MPYYDTSQEWLRQSSLLIAARPTTTRITTKYHIEPPRPRRLSKKLASTATTTTNTTASLSQAPTPTQDVSSTTTETTTATKPPRGSLVLKTYDPRSGVVLKYRTTKAAEVTRLILALGQLGNRMAGFKREEEEVDIVMADIPIAPGGRGRAEEDEQQQAKPQTKPQTGGESAAKAAQSGGQPEGKPTQGGGGGGGKGKKKRAKK